MIEKQEVILPAGDGELIQQLSTRRGWPNSRGELELWSKADLRSRGIGSPDKANALLMAFRPEITEPFAVAAASSR